MACTSPKLACCVFICLPAMTVHDIKRLAQPVRDRSYCLICCMQASCCCTTCTHTTSPCSGSWVVIAVLAACRLLLAALHALVPQAPAAAGGRLAQRPPACRPGPDALQVRSLPSYSSRLAMQTLCRSIPFQPGQSCRSSCRNLLQNVKRFKLHACCLQRRAP